MPEAAPAAPRFTVRPYQADALLGIDEALQRVRSTLVVMPTGTGKTVVFAHAIDRFSKKRALVLAHREELLTQASGKIYAITGRTTQIEQAENYAYRKHDRGVVVASVPSMVARRGDGFRGEQFNPHDFDLLIIDEAHHAVADTYRKVLKHFRQNPALGIVGVTATPDRADEEALGQIFDSVAYEYEIGDAIRDGWLVPIRQRMVEVEGLDYSTVRTTAGDLNQGDVAEIVEREQTMHMFAHPTIELAGDRKTLLFAATVKQAEGIADILNRHRTDCARIVSGTTPTDERRELFRAYARGDFQFLCNCAVATEGFDEPSIAVVVMCRPTKSRALYSQMAGRGTRPLPGLVDSWDTAELRRQSIADSAKPHVEIIDFVGNSGRHKLVTTADILGAKYSDEAVAMAQEIAAGGDSTDMLSALEQAQQIIHDQKKRAAEAQAKREAAQKTVSNPKGPNVTVQAQYLQHMCDPFDVLDIEPERERGYFQGKQLTEAMRKVLEGRNFDPDKLTYTHAQQVIKEIRKRDMVTVKQARQLLRHRLDPSKFTCSRASALMGLLAQNGWRLNKAWVKPEDFQVSR